MNAWVKTLMGGCLAAATLLGACGGSAGTGSTPQQGARPAAVTQGNTDTSTPRPSADGSQPLTEEECRARFEQCVASGADPLECKPRFELCMSQVPPPPPPDPAVFCEEVRKACLEMTGGDTATCNARYEHCMSNPPPPPPDDVLRPCREAAEQCLASGAPPEECRKRYDICVAEHMPPPPPPPGPVCPAESCGFDLAKCIRLGEPSSTCLSRFDACVGGSEEPPPPPPPPAECDVVRMECLKAGGTPEACEERYKLCTATRTP
jgi:hypothetical protein